MKNNCYEANWTKVKGVDVLVIAGSDYVAAPVSGRQNSRRFDIINATAGEYVCQLLKSEVNAWLISRAESDGVAFNAYCELLDNPIGTSDIAFHGIVPQVSWKDVTITMPKAF
jgi:hypothetical protein